MTLYTPQFEVAEDFLANLQRRPRRNRISPAVRALTRETELTTSDLILPFFVRDGHNQREEVKGMPEVFRLSPDQVLLEAEAALRLGIKAVILYPVIAKEHKDAFGSEALRPDNLLNRTVTMLKREIPELCIFIDIALDPYTSHGHDGLVNEHGEVLNDETVRALGAMAVLAAQAGVDVVAPSDMMDGRIGYIRRVLDANGLRNTGILSYAAKYASSIYSPYREALQSAPAHGDKKGYQMDPANSREAVMEALLDIEEGADMLLIKPALPYLDIISKVRSAVNVPVGAYQVSGEYSMIMAAAANGWLDADKTMLEFLVSIKRAGADFIMSYAATRVARSL